MVRKGSGIIGRAAAAPYLRRLGAVALLLVSSAGCEDEACFSWTKQEGACPSQDDAISFFVSPGCVGSIQTVDSSGEFVEAPEDPIPGDLCCYQVTKTSNDFGSCQGSSSAGARSTDMNPALLLALAFATALAAGGRLLRWQADFRLP